MSQQLSRSHINARAICRNYDAELLPGEVSRDFLVSNILHHGQRITRERITIAAATGIITVTDEDDLDAESSTGDRFPLNLQASDQASGSANT